MVVSKRPAVFQTSALSITGNCPIFSQISYGSEKSRSKPKPGTEPVSPRRVVELTHSLLAAGIQLVRILERRLYRVTPVLDHNNSVSNTGKSGFVLLKNKHRHSYQVLISHRSKNKDKRSKFHFPASTGSTLTLTQRDAQNLFTRTG